MDGIWSARRHGDHLECLTSKGKKILKSYRTQQQQQQQQQQLISPKQQKYHVVDASQPKSLVIQEKIVKDLSPRTEVPPVPILVRNNKQERVSGISVLSPEQLHANKLNESISPHEPSGNSVQLANAHQNAKCVANTHQNVKCVVNTHQNCDSPTVMSCDSDQSPQSVDSQLSCVEEKEASAIHASLFSGAYSRRDETVLQNVKVEPTELLETESSCVVSIEGNEEDDDDRGEEDKMIVAAEKATIRPKHSGADWLCRAGMSVRWSGVSVSASGKTLLSGVSGHCAPGRIFAIMGPSGSGKTTLLNALSGRVRCEGSVWLGDRPLSRKLRHLVGYSSQHDLFHPHLRLRQMLQFTADLRLPETLSQEQKTAAVDSVISMLALTQCQNTIIGDASVRGLSGGERKRASIACELLTDPPVLVLDEPTSGLDAHAAHSLISQLKCLAVGEGRAVLLSLHQPSSRVFHMLDTVLLLSQGRPAYLGPSRDVAQYLAKLGLPLQPHYNPADFLLEVANEHSDRLIRHYEECRADDDVKQTTSPPQWVFQQHLSSLSSDSSCKNSFRGDYQKAKTLIKDPESDRILSVSLPENDRISRVSLPSNPEASSNGLHDNNRISSAGFFENARVSSPGLSNHANVSSPRLPETTRVTSPCLPEGRAQRFTSDASTIDYSREGGDSVRNEDSFDQHLGGGVMSCVCGNVFPVSCESGDENVFSEAHFHSDKSHTEQRLNSVTELSKPLVDSTEESRPITTSTSTNEYPLYVTRKFSMASTDNIESLPQVLSCTKCAGRRGQDLQDARSCRDPTNDSHDSGYDQNRDLERVSGSLQRCGLPQNLHPPFTSDSILNKSAIPSDETAPECPLVGSTRSRSVRRDESDSGRESCSSDHSDAASCLVSSVLPFASSRRISHHGAPESRWPASYWTQCRVLTARCFAVYRPIITSKINWVQTLGFALMAGVLWFQAPRTEEGITDLQGWMFFSTSYWMMHSHFQALNTFPREKAVLEKERSSGWYRISAYYIAKSVSELPLTIALPSLYFVISYPLMGFSGVSVMLLLLLMLLLNALVAQSLGLLVSVTFCNIEHCWAVSALITLFQQLFGGYLATRVPPWMEWARYLSMVQYAYSNMCYIEFSMGPPVMCAEQLSRFPSCASGDTETVPVDEILASTGADLATSTNGSPVWMNTSALLLYLITARLLAYLVLRFRYRPNY